MEYHVHICCVGTNPDPSVAMTRSGIPIDCVYLLCAKEDAYGAANVEMNRKLRASENEVENILRRDGIPAVEIRRVDPWDFQGIIDRVLDIVAEVDSRRSGARYHINFTSGTHVMAGAVSCAAFYIGADLYYVRNREDHADISAGNELQRFSIPFIPDVEKLKGSTREVLFLLDDGGYTANSVLLQNTGLTPSKLGYHTKVLKGYGLVEQDRSGKEVSWKLTYPGRVAVRILRRPLKK